MVDCCLGIFRIWSWATCILTVHLFAIWTASASSARSDTHIASTKQSVASLCLTPLVNIKSTLCVFGTCNNSTLMFFREHLSVNFLAFKSILLKWISYLEVLYSDTRLSTAPANTLHSFWCMFKLLSTHHEAVQGLPCILMLLRFYQEWVASLCLTPWVIRSSLFCIWALKGLLLDIHYFHEHLSLNSLVIILLNCSSNLEKII